LFAAGFHGGGFIIGGCLLVFHGWSFIGYAIVVLGVVIIILGPLSFSYDWLPFAH
jgi:hypothetical protein